MENGSFAGKEEVEREEGQHRGGQSDSVHSLAPAKTAGCAGGCRAAVAREHRVKGLPCGNQYVIRARCVVEAIRRGGSQAQLFYGTNGCTARRERRESSEAALQADPGLHVTVAGLGGRMNIIRSERREALCNPGDQPSLGIAGPLDDVSL